MDMKMMDIKEFVELGYLQELNRLSLHPLGLALVVSIDDETGEYKLSGIWDQRDDPEGIVFAEGEQDPEKYDRIVAEYKKRAVVRSLALGYVIQTVDD
jgi:hypothetical protein